MSAIKYIPFEEESSDIKHRVTEYWTERADSFFVQREHELHSPKAKKWRNEIMGQLADLSRDQQKEGITGHTDCEITADAVKKTDNTGEKDYFDDGLPMGRPLKILDVGCGAGFFPVLLAKEGFDVTGIDLTEEMIEKAGEMIGENAPYKGSARVMAMDAENISFDDETFDVVITRNLTWTLPHPVEAYSEWYRVLKKGGMLLNFDAEYAKGAHRLNDMDNLAHRCISEKLKDECHEIYHMLTISALIRPEWDAEVLSHIGFEDIRCDREFCDRIFAERDEFYIPDRMFMIRARK